MQGLDFDTLEKGLISLYYRLDHNKDGLISLPEFVDAIQNRFYLNAKDVDMKEKFNTIDVHRCGSILRKDFLDYYLAVVARQWSNILSRSRDCGIYGIMSVIRQFSCPLDVAVLMDIFLNLNNEPKPQEKLKTINPSLYHLATSEARSVLEYWFPRDMKRAMNLWFGKSVRTDNEIRDNFSHLVEKAVRGELDHWQTNPVDCLALILLLDQFTRNVFRHKAEMYKGDEKALGIVSRVLYRNYIYYFTPEQTVFLPCLVLTHSESIHHQELCLEIWNHNVGPRLSEDDPLHVFGDIFLNHHVVIKQFGRFPHRNEILGRTSTPEEEVFLKDSTFRFDLPMVYDEEKSRCRFVLQNGKKEDVRRHSSIKETSVREIKSKIHDDDKEFITKL